MAAGLPVRSCNANSSAIYCKENPCIDNELDRLHKLLLEGGGSDVKSKIDRCVAFVQIPSPPDPSG